MTDWLTDGDLATLIGKGRAFVQDRCRSQEWPHIRVGKSYRFTPEHVAQITALLTVQPQQTPAGEVADSWGRRGRSA